MRNTYITTALLFLALALSGQDIISRTTSILNSGGVFYLVDSTLLDNGQPLPDLEVTRRLIGDTSQVAQYLKRQAMNVQEGIAKDVAEAMKRGRANTDFLSYRSIYNTVTGRELFQDIEAETYQDYAGTYRVFDLAADSNFVANLVRVGARRRFRLEHAQTGQQWAILPLTRENFRLMNWNGENIDLYYDREIRKNGFRVFEESRRVTGEAVIRIVKVPN